MPCFDMSPLELKGTPHYIYQFVTGIYLSWTIRDTMFYTESIISGPSCIIFAQCTTQVFNTIIVGFSTYSTYQHHSEDTIWDFQKIHVLCHLVHQDCRQSYILLILWEGNVFYIVAGPLLRAILHLIDKLHIMQIKIRRKIRIRFAIAKLLSAAKGLFTRNVFLKKYTIKALSQKSSLG